MSLKIQQLQQHLHVQYPKKTKITQKTNFTDVLEQVQSLKISKHAQQRLIERNIQIDDSKWEIVSQKMNEAKAKGVTDSLIIMDQATLLVSTKNNTVITAMDRTESGSKLFTNINGTILIND